MFSPGAILSSVYGSYADVRQVMTPVHNERRRLHPMGGRDQALHIAKKYVERREYENAMQELETHDLATSAEGCELLGLCFRHRGDTKRALKHFRQALQLDSKRMVNQLYVAEELVGLVANGHTDVTAVADAQDALKTAAELFPGDPRIFALRKEMYSAQGDRASIEALIQQEIDSDPMSAKGYILQADHLISVGNVVNAWQLCKETSMCLAHSAEWSEQSVDLLDRIVKANVIPAEKSHLALLNAIVGVLHRHIRSRDGKEITAKYLLKLEDGIAAASVAWGKLSTNTCRADRCAECLKEFRAQQIAYCGLFLLHHVDHTPASDERMRCAILCHMISFDQGFVSLDKVKESGVDDDDVNAMASMSRSRVYESEQILRRALAVQQEDCLDQVLAVGLSRLGDVLKRWMLCTNATLEVAIPVSGAAIRHSLSVNAPQDIAHSSASIVTENIANLDFLVMACASAIMYRSNPSSLLRGVINAFSGYLPLHESGARSLDKLRCDDAAAFVWALAWKRIYAMDRNTGAHSSGRDGTRSTEPSRPDFFDHLSYVTPDCYMTPLQQRFWATVLQAGTAYMGETINGVRTLTLHESIDYLQQLRRANALEQPESTAYMPVQLLIALGDWFGSCAVAVVADDNFAGVPPAESFRLAKSLRSRTVVYYANADAVGSNAMKHATIPLDRAMSPAAARVNASGATRFGRTSFMSGTPSRLRHAISRPTGRSGAPSERRETRNILLDLDAADYGRHGEFAELLKSCLTPYADALLSLQRHHEALAILSRIGTAVACKRSADLRMQLLREFVDTRLTPTTQKRPSEGELRSFLAMQADAYREYARCISGSATDDADGSFAMTTWSAEEEREINAHMDELCTTLRSALCAALGHGGGNGMATPPGNGNGLNASLVTLRSFPSTPIPKTPGAATAIPALHPVSASKFKDAQSRILDRLKGTQNSASPKPSPLHAQATSTPVAHQAPSTHNSNISESSPNDAQAVSDVMSFFIELGIPPMLVTLAEKLGADSRADFAGLNEDDLKEVGFKPVHRRKILGHFHAATSPQEPLAATGANDSNLSIILDQIKDHLARTHQESPAAAVKLQSSAHGSPFLLRDTECTVIHNTAEGVTDTERKDARELQLPENFYTYTRVYPRTEYRQQIPVETIDSIIEKLPAFSCSSVDAPRFGMENSLSSSPLRSQQSVDRSTSLILGDTTGLNDQRDTIGAPSTATPANATSIPEFRIGSNTGRDGLSLSSLPSGTGRNSASSVSNSAAGGTVMNAGGGFSFASGGSGGFTFGSGLAGKTASGGTETAKPSAASDDKGTDKKGPGLFAGLDLTGSTASSSSTGSTLFGGSGGLFGAKSNEGSTTEGGSGSAMSPSSNWTPQFSAGRGDVSAASEAATSTSPTAASPKSVSLDLTGAAAADKGDNSGGTVGTVTLERDSVTSLFSDGHDTNPGAALTGNSVSSSGSSGSKSVPGAAAGGATFNFSFGMDKVPSPKSFIQGGAGAFSVGAGLFNNVSSLSPPGQLFGNTPPPVTAAAAGGDDGGGAFSPGGLFGGGATFSPSAKPFSPATLSAHLGSAGPSPSSAPLDPQQDSNENSANGDETDDGEDDYENYNEGEEVEDYGKEFDGETDDPDAYFAGYANYDDGTLAAGSPSDDYSGSLGEVPENLSIGSPVHNDDGGDDLDASALLQLAQSAPPHTFAVPRAPARSGDEGGGAGDGFSGATSGADTTGKPRRIAKGRRKKNLQPAMVPATSMAALQQYDDDVGTDGGWSTCSDSDTGADVA
eukprot:m.333079 g.333079  ORF g.333079 m.333079 type:complete len:1775 (+) comp20502_c0_seq2:93-5417(+)